MKLFALIALTSAISLQDNKKWVELPNCPGTVVPAVELADDVSNASSATCKKAPAPAALAQK